MSKNGKRQLAKSSARMVRGFLHQYFEVSTLSYRLALQKNGNAKNYGEEGDEEHDRVLMKECRHIQSQKRPSEKPTYEWNRLLIPRQKLHTSFPTNYALISWEILPNVLYVQLINAESNNTVILTYCVNPNRYYQPRLLQRDSWRIDIHRKGAVPFRQSSR